jgi:hypothetical protein
MTEDAAHATSGMIVVNMKIALTTSRCRAANRAGPALTLKHLVILFKREPKALQPRASVIAPHPVWIALIP